jgi:23S rRNA (uridine2552-2'-O)-methyltransferase
MTRGSKPGAGKAGGSGPRKPGGSGQRGMHERVKTARRRTVSSNRWLERQLNDPYGSRAAYKLIELDEKFGFLGKARAVADLGITPGGWSQVVRKANPRAAVAGIDLLECAPIDGVTILQQDFMDDSAPEALLAALGSMPDLVLSDMAANTVGHQMNDYLRTMGLIEAGLDMAGRLLRPGGAFVAKVLAGGGDGALTALLKQSFASVKHAKPPASRKGSPELFVVAQGFRGREDGGA